MEIEQQALKVLGMIADGASDEKIGEALGLDIDSVRTRIESIYRMIGVGDRMQAALWTVANIDLGEDDDKDGAAE